MITFNANERLFHLRARDVSYVLKVLPSGLVAHLYFGPRLRSDSLTSLLGRSDRTYAADARTVDFIGRLDQLPQEYPSYGSTDFRPPAIEVRNTDGSSMADLRYVAHHIAPGKPKLAGLPATYVEDAEAASSLTLTLLDAVTGLEVNLLYTVFRDYPVVARSVRIANRGQARITLARVLSLSLDFDSCDWEVVSLSGSWSRERQVFRRPLANGSFLVESARGISSHQQSPFLALARRDTSEAHGAAYGFSLVYSGNFLAQVDVDQFQSTRVLMGINPFDFSWQLDAGEEFQAPEVVSSYSHAGLGQLSRDFHELYRSNLARGRYRDAERPIVINNWEATYFDFDADKIEAIAQAGAKVGIELMVLDDGWFGRRDRDDSSLGDWIVDRRKLPLGLDELARRVNRCGLKFGLWFEPEMVSPDSNLYRAHPDWCLHVPNRARSEIRNQLVLDLSRSEVRDHIVDAVSAVLESAPIAYVKWDMNRPLTEMGSASLPPERQREIAHRYVLGVYDMMSRITERFPDVLFESCAGGGGRFDAGILHYMPQAWTSDNMDPVERLKIQWGTSLVFPACSMGAHVCSAKNHITDRTTALETRAAVAMSGVFGYELDLTQLTESELAAIGEQAARYKQVRRLVQFGDLYRLRSPFESRDCAWCFVSRDKAEAFVVYVSALGEPNPPVVVLRLAGLDPLADYELEGTGTTIGGDQLMYAGLSVPRLKGDAQSATWRLVRIRVR